MKGSEFLFASNRNRGVCFACFALKQNSRFHKQNENKIKRHEAKKAKQNETKEVKQKIKLKEAKRNILKQNERKTSSIYFCFEAK